MTFHGLFDLYSYAANESVNSGGDAGLEDSTNKETHTHQPSVSLGTYASLPEITIETIQHSKELVMFYTGMTDSNTFYVLFESLMEQEADKLSTEIIGTMNKHNLGRKRKLKRVDEVLLVMMLLRLGLLLKDLEFCFKISASAVSNIFNSWILFMHECMQSLVFLQDLEVLKLHVPKCF